VERKADELDAEPDLLNTPAGVVDLATGFLLPHDPGLFMTKITSGSYRPGYTHPDWTKALEALPKAEREWFQTRIGQSITGHTTPDGVMPILQGAGENGKSALTTDGPVPALGGYASMASTKLFQTSKGSEHSTERAELRGKRLLIAEELTEGRSIDVTALKQIQDVSMITARYVHRDNFTFRASHSLFTTTNYRPVVSETDHGTWRRLALLRFPFTFRKPGQELQSDSDRVGDTTLKARIGRNANSQHDAIVTWAVEGAMRWYADPDTALLPTPTVEADTRAWRAEADRILGFWDERRCFQTRPGSGSRRRDWRMRLRTGPVRDGTMRRA
jgi:putative DNA primase/helicase